VREHLVVHQFDPAEQIAGGVHGFIVELVRYAPPEHSFRLVGVDSTGARKLGAWYDVVIGDRAARFLPVARLSAGRPQRRVPHTLRLVAGMLARRPSVGDAIVHAHRVEVAAALDLAYPRAPLAQFVHTDSSELLRHRVESFWKVLPRTQLALERRAVRRADRTIVFSGAAARRLAAESSRVSAGTNWFDESVFFPGEAREDAPVAIGWIGRFEASKNPLDAVDVFARLAARNGTFRGWFAGSGTLEDELQKRVVQRGLGDRVKLLGTLPPGALAEQLRATHVLLVTSLWEGQPRAVLEALACGTSVVSTDVGDVRALVVDGANGYVAGGRSADELASLVEAAAPLAGDEAVAASVSHLRAGLVVPKLLEELECIR
jgi:glycosyltransferase involved in cell wall biosynthesis